MCGRRFAGWTALPVALTASATGLLGISQWKENYARFARTGEALKNERIKFETQTADDYDENPDPQTELDNFGARVEAPVMGEVSDWRGLMQEAMETNKTWCLGRGRGQRYAPELW